MPTKIVFFKGFWDVDDVRNYPNSLFVYGDNNAQLGKGGQAIIRDEINTIGIPTKKYPSFHSSSYYNDAEYNDNTNRISTAVNKIIDVSKQYKYVVLPEKGFGVGLADLPNKAPLTYKFLLKELVRLKKSI